MMRKITALAIAIGIASNCYANIMPITKTNLQSLKSVHYFNLKNAGYTFGYMNLFGDKPVVVRILVNEYYGYTDQKSDKVMLSCNEKKSYIKAGTWVTCGIKPGSSADVNIMSKDFHVGADGAYVVI